MDNQNNELKSRKSALFYDFLKAVREMRCAQVEYFRTKMPGALKNSRSLEKEVDRLLKEIDAIRAGKTAVVQDKLL